MPDRTVSLRLAVLPCLAGLMGCCCGMPSTEAASPRQPAVITVGPQPVTREIRAARHWNDTGLQVDAGKHYQFSAGGQWCDWFVLSGPEGYQSIDFFQAWTEKWRRVPDQPWFSLICAVDRDPDPAKMVAVLTPDPDGLGRSFTGSGELTCFANDLGAMYWNNSGAIAMTVRRIE
jgi:hypothetical protein